MSPRFHETSIPAIFRPRATRLFTAAMLLGAVFSLTCHALTLYVSGTGNDATGDGSETAPFRSITRALTNSPAPDLVLVGSGIYDAASGEVFPITVANGQSVAATNGAAAVVDAAYSGSILLLGPGNSSNLVSGLRLRRAKGTAIIANDWQGTIANMDITDIQDGGATNSTCVLYYAGNNSRPVTMSGCVVTGILSATRHAIRFDAGPNGLFTLTNCLFSDIVLTQQQLDKNVGFIGGTYSTYGQGYSFAFVDCRFENVSFRGYDPNLENGMFGTWYRGSTFDRCMFLNVSSAQGGGYCSIVACNRNSSILRNCLFHRCNPGSGRAAVGGFWSDTRVYNCTFDSISNAVFRPQPSGSETIRAYNSIVSRSAGLCAANFNYLHLVSSCLFDTPFAGQYNTDYSANLSSSDPLYANAAATNFRLRTVSPLVDWGTNAYAPPGPELDHSERIRDGDADGSATVDMGCYEVNFLDPSEPVFRFPKPAYRLFAGQTSSIPVWIQPQPGAPAQAGVYPHPDITTTGLLAFPSGPETNTLAVEVASSPGSGNGDLVSIWLAETNTSLGVLPAEIGIYVHRRQLTIGSTNRLLVRSGTTNDIAIRFVNSALSSPGQITISTNAAAGSGSNIFSWEGPNIITNGGWRSEGFLRVIAGSGSNSITLAADNGFVFVESGSSSLVVEAVGFASPVYVSTNGSDSSGDGSSNSPFATVTFALGLLSAGDQIRLLPGVYGTNTGETFPLQPGGVSIVGHTLSGATLPDNQVFDGRGASLNILKFASPSVTGFVANITFSNGALPMISLDQGRAVVSNCHFRNTAVADTLPAAAYLCNNARLTAIGCNFSSLRGRGSVGIEQAPLYNNDVRFDATDCVFANNYSTYGTVYAGPSVVARITLQDCLFRSNAVPFNSKVHDAYPSTGCYIWGDGHPGSCTLSAERCRFIDNTNGSVFGTSYMGATTPIRNCLFVNNTCDLELLGGYTWGAWVDNCTFVSNRGVYSGYNPYLGVAIRNSIIVTNRSDIGNSLSLRFLDTMAYQSSLGSYDSANSSNLMVGVNPDLRPDHRLRSGSPAIDAGCNAWVSGALDLALGPRLVDGDMNGVTNVDLGCYEFNPFDTNTPHFATPLPSYKVFAGRSMQVPVYIVPQPETAVQASVSYPAGVTGTNVLTFPTGKETNLLQITVLDPLSVSNGSLVTVLISETNTAAGVESWELGLRLYQPLVYMDSCPARLFIRPGQTNQFFARLENSSLASPGDTAIVSLAPAGAGTHSIQWIGSNVITNGGWRTEGALRIVGGSGVNTVTLTVDNAFRFASTGISTMSLEVISCQSPLYVSPSGDDSSGFGTVASPFRTITYASTLLLAGEEIRLLPGSYSAASAETLPIQPGPIRIVGCDAAGSPAASFCSLHADGSAVNIMRFYQLGQSATAYVANVTFSNATRAAILMDQSCVVAENCVFRQMTCPSTEPVGALLYNNSRFTALNCTFESLNGRGAIGIEYNTVANNDNVVTASNCLFAGNYSYVGTLYSYSSVAGKFNLTDCRFENNSAPNNAVQDSYSSTAVYIWGNGSYPSLLQINRCRFTENMNGVLFGISYISGISIRNSLFAGNKPNWDMLYGYNWGGSILNCTFVRNKGSLSGRWPANGNIYLRNSVVSSNDTAIGSQDTYFIMQTSLVWQASLGSYNTSSSSGIITNSDPMLRSDYQLLSGSPAIDAGNNGWVSDPYDLAGRQRIRFNKRGAIVDLGAFEKQGDGTVFTAR